MRKIISKQSLLLLSIILIGGVFRFYRLTDFPVQLNHDEISQLYDAISIAETGKDVYGNFMPTIFPSVNDFKSPFYTYITSLFYLFLGNKEVIIKLPGVIFGWLTIIAVYFFVLKLFKNWRIAICASFFTAISPFEIFFSRKSFENVAGIFFMLFGFASLLAYIDKKSNTRMLYIGFLFLAIATYTYFSHAILIPFLLFSFVLIYREHFLNNVKRVLLPVLVLGVLLVPLVLIIITNPGARYRSKTVFITQDVNLERNIEYSKSENYLTSFLLKNKAILDFSFNRYLEQFNVDFIFANGLDFTGERLLNQGLLLLIQLPLFVLGLIYLIRLNGFKQAKMFILAWILLGMLPSGLTFESHSPHRSIMVFTMLNIICAVGFYWFIQITKKSKRFFYPLICLFALALIFNFMYFIHMYFVNFPFERSQHIQYPFKQVALYAWSQYQNFDSIIFDPQFGDFEPKIGAGAYYYFAYYGQMPPDKFQKEYRLGDKPREVLFDKFSIREVYWLTDKDLKNTLVIASPWSVREKDIEDKNKIIKRFFFYNGKLAFYAIKL
ncbi:MAG: glycosyltransferase family 39 protein [Candidatus Daviesbacteria bacterium]|nr:glycosyltransferase family 39 protein [Candidatus Daviesbacteria bacterium]